MCALDAEHEQDDVGDVHLGAIDLDGDTEEAHGLEALLVVKPPHEDVDVVDEWVLVLLEPTDDALEHGSHVGAMGILKLAMLPPMMRILLSGLDMLHVMRSAATVVTGEQAGRVQT